MQLTALERSDLTRLREAFAMRGCVSIDSFLPEDEACALAGNLAQRQDWVEVFQGKDQAYDMAAGAFEALDLAQKRQLDELVWQQAARGFQFRFRSIRVPDAREQRVPSQDELHAFAEFMCSAPVMDHLRLITACDDIAFADAQATAYSAGHFLTAHDDDVAGKGRRAAYVFSLTENWSADWGGLLVFPQGEELTGFLPAFNCLRIFRVPQPHSVTFVPPFVSQTRYSITGWLRTAPS